MFDPKDQIPATGKNSITLIRITLRPGFIMGQKEDFSVQHTFGFRHAEYLSRKRDDQLDLISRVWK